MEGVEGRGEEGARGNTLSSVQYQVGVRTYAFRRAAGGKRGRDTLKSVGIHPPPGGPRLKKKKDCDTLSSAILFKKRTSKKLFFASSLVREGEKVIPAVLGSDFLSQPCIHHG